MRKSLLFMVSFVVTLFFSCGSQQTKGSFDVSDADSLAMVLEGDSTVYGLVCDGTSDTLLVFLSVKDIQSDPDTFDILSATRHHRVLGRLKIGDNIAIVRNANDSTVADFVVDMEDLQATWCYQVLPTLHVRADMVGKTEKQKINNLPDSVKELLTVAREYSMQLKADHSVSSRGNYRQSLDDDRLVDYPRMKRYGQWHLYNGKLLLSEMAFDSLGNTRIMSTDTADFLLMSPDTLVLRFKDETRHYYSKEK